MDDLEEVASLFKPGDLATIQPEGSEEIFHVHKSILCKASPYFTAALESGYMESAKQHLRIPGCDAPSLKLFIYWLHTKNVPAFDFEMQETMRIQGKHIDTSLPASRVVLLANLWVLGDYLDMREMQNAAMDAIIDITRVLVLPLEAFGEAYSIAPEQSTLSKALVAEAQHAFFHVPRLDFHPEVLVRFPDFLARLMSGIRTTAKKSETTILKEFRCVSSLPRKRFMVTPKARKENVQG